MKPPIPETLLEKTKMAGRIWPGGYRGLHNGGLIWLTHQLTVTAIAVCRKMDSKWYIAEDDSFSDEVGPFSNLDSLCPKKVDY